MNVDVLSKTNNPLIGRVEYIIEVSYDKATPKRADVRQAIVEKVGCSPDLLVIKKIQQHAGMKKSRVIAYVYGDDETLRRIEPLYILKRNGLIKEEKENKPNSG